MERRESRSMSRRAPSDVEYQMCMHYAFLVNMITVMCRASSKAFACSHSTINHSSIVWAVAQSCVYPLICIITIMLHTLLLYSFSFLLLSSSFAESLPFPYEPQGSYFLFICVPIPGLLGLHSLPCHWTCSVRSVCEFK